MAGRQSVHPVHWQAQSDELSYHVAAARAVYGVKKWLLSGSVLSPWLLPVSPKQAFQANRQDAE